MSNIPTPERLIKHNIRILLSLLFLALSLSAEEFYIQKDKQKHFVGSMAVGGVATGIARHYGSNKLEAMFIGIASALLVGIAKEKYDSQGNGTEDINDVYADAIGASFGATLFSWEF